MAIGHLHFLSVNLSEPSPIFPVSCSFYLLVCENSLYILEMNSLLHIVSIFSFWSFFFSLIYCH